MEDSYDLSYDANKEIRVFPKIKVLPSLNFAPNSISSAGSLPTRLL